MYFKAVLYVGRRLTRPQGALSTLQTLLQSVPVNFLKIDRNTHSPPCSKGESLSLRVTRIDSGNRKSDKWRWISSGATWCVSFITGLLRDGVTSLPGHRFLRSLNFWRRGWFFEGMSNELRWSQEPARLILDYGAAPPNTQALNKPPQPSWIFGSELVSRAEA